MDHTTEHHSASGARQLAAMAGHITRELSRYDVHLRDVRGLAAGTRKHCTRIVGRLLHRKFAKRPIEIAKLRPDDIREFLASRLDAYQAPSQASKLAAALRVICVTEPPAATRLAHCLRSFRTRCTGVWRHCHGP